MPDDFKRTAVSKNLWEFIYLSMAEKNYCYVILIKKHAL